MKGFHLHVEDLLRNETNPPTTPCFDAMEEEEQVVNGGSGGGNGEDREIWVHHGLERASTMESCMVMSRKKL